MSINFGERGYLKFTHKELLAFALFLGSIFGPIGKLWVDDMRCQANLQQVRDENKQILQMLRGLGIKPRVSVDIDGPGLP